ncbi:GGDEF domain-containing protein [Methylonatrum kenyense]|uniref:putative bifunctional diguanylate cyclase/phosphodiesterase n=1 Tax=Methylonatrum kenyense TaxID=455253 RepID=UPI0020C05EF7|nr:GGDEF domain-containing protein [Methylonatrum kenyense]MCK8515221.1 GGDEF domain-containing protein [Methylonatrum kenyense]
MKDRSDPNSGNRPADSADELLARHFPAGHETLLVLTGEDGRLLSIGGRPTAALLTAPRTCLLPDLVHEDDRTLLLSALRRCRSGERESVNLSFRLANNASGDREFSLTLRRLDDDNLIGVVNDPASPPVSPANPAAASVDPGIHHKLQNYADELGNRPLADLPEAIRDSLSSVGQHTGAGRVYLFSLKGPRHILRRCAAWQHRDAPPPLRKGPHSLETLPWIRERLRRGQSVVLHDPDELPESAAAERALLAREGIRAFSIIPIRHTGLLRGFVAMDRCVPAHPWSAEQLQLLQSVATLLTMALLRQHNGRSLHRMMFFDPITGLRNRDALRQRLEDRLERLSGQSFSVVLLDLDDADTVRDLLDQDAMDRLLSVLAERLRDQLKTEEMVARWGNDGFMLILDNDPTGETTEHRLEGILHALMAPVLLAGHALNPGFSTGVCRYPDDSRHAPDLLRFVELAMRDARRQGRCLTRHFSSVLETQAIARSRIRQRLVLAIENDAMELHYQPLVSTHTGKLAGVEALLRWTDAELGVVPPHEFVDIAEHSGLIQPLGDWVLRRACRDLLRWQAAGLHVPRVAVNASPHQLQDGHLPDKIRTLLDEYGLPGARLELEITESTLMEREQRGLAVLQRLRAMGIGLAIDDFGTGYSSLGKLKHLPVTVLKIDHSFVRDILTDPSDHAIIRAILAMARQLRLRVVAEGVETLQQLELLRIEGCDVTQGYIHAPAMSADDLVAWSQRQRRPE